MSRPEATSVPPCRMELCYPHPRRPDVIGPIVCPVTDLRVLVYLPHDQLLAHLCCYCCMVTLYIHTFEQHETTKSTDLKYVIRISIYMLIAVLDFYIVYFVLSVF
jgi:hypothetical protein